MTVHSFPVSGTQDYSSRHEVLFEFTNWLISTGFFTEFRASNGTVVTTGAIATAADFNNVGSHRILRSKDGHEIAFWRRTSASVWTILIAVSPGFVTGGDATTVPTAVDETALIGSRFAGADFDPSIGSTEYWRFVADDSIDGQVYWGFGSFYSNFLRYGIFRFPVVPWAPDKEDPDPAVYDIRSNGTSTFLARREVGTWGNPTVSTVGPSGFAGTFKMSPTYRHFDSADHKGFVPFSLSAKRGDNTEKGVYETPRGYWACEQSVCYYMGETEPDLASAGFPSRGTAYEIFPFVAPEPPPETVAPVVVFNTSNLSDLNPSDPISVDVTDNNGSFARIFLYVKFVKTGIVEVVHDGAEFAPYYTQGSAVQVIANGFRYSVKRFSGWPSSSDDNNIVVFHAVPIDSVGNVGL